MNDTTWELSTIYFEYHTDNPDFDKPASMMSLLLAVEHLLTLSL